MTQSKSLVREHAFLNPSSGKEWLNCGIWVAEKKKCEAEGREWSTGGEAADRGTFMHDISEVALENFLSVDDLAVTLLDHIEMACRVITERWENEDRTIPPSFDQENDLEQIETVLKGVLEVLEQYSLQTAIEVGVELAHEPGQFGHVDVLGFSEELLFVHDHKYGVTPVEPDGPQNKLYAYNALRMIHEKFGFVPARVLLSIGQPARSQFLFTKEIDSDELIKWGHWADENARQKMAGEDVSGAGHLSTCDWCPVKTSCAHRADVARHAVSVAMGSTPGVPDDVTEWLVRGKSEIEEVLEEARQRVITQPEVFPRWFRKEVSNGRKFNPAADPNDIAHELRLAGADNFYRLDTPASIMKKNKSLPNVGKALDKVTIDGGTHVRLKYTGKEVGQPMAGFVAPPEPKAKKKAPAKKKKAAPKKAPAKKKAAKKAAKPRPSGSRKKRVS